MRPLPAPGEQRIETRYPGFDIEADSSGYFKVGHIYKQGPADHEYTKIEKGNFVLAVDGKDLRTTDNYWKLLNVLPGRKFEFTVNSKPEREGAWSVIIDPISPTAQRDLEYQRWVDGRKALVDRLSNGEIGYLHIRAMDGPSLNLFIRELTENVGRKALDHRRSIQYRR